MAIYHLEAKVVSRGNGRSACAASAYISCSAIYNDYDGVQHDFTRKHGLLWSQVFLPVNAPEDWRDRSNLWNAVEENEKTKDSRLAREFVAALPIELSEETCEKLLTDFIQTQFVTEGMCADVAVHDTDNHNPHAHIMLTVRPINEDGSWQYKAEKEYLCMKNGEECGFTAAEYKIAKKEGWEKQYRYQDGRKKIYMTPSAAERKGLKRLSKDPKSTKYGRQNPISERWNSDEQLLLWREAWAVTVNRYLEQAGLDARIDHRSHAARGLDEQPTIHEGVAARTLEAKGLISDRCELNRQIKADNRMLREAKAEVQRLLKALQDTIPAIAAMLEKIRQKMIIISYQIRYARKAGKSLRDALKDIKPDYDQYVKIVSRIRDLRRERKELLANKKALSPLQFGEHHRISQRVASLTEEIEDLRSEKRIVMERLYRYSDQEMKEVRKWVRNTEAELKKAEAADQKYSAELAQALQEYRDAGTQAAGLEPDALSAARSDLRADSEQEAGTRLQNAYAGKYDPELMSEARADVAALLGETAVLPEKGSITRRLQENHEKMKQTEAQRSGRKRRPHEQEL